MVGRWNSLKPHRRKALGGCKLQSVTCPIRLVAESCLRLASCYCTMYTWQANIRVMSGQPFPSIEGMVMDMELRRDGAEGKVWL